MLSGGGGGGLNLSALLGQHQSIEGELAVSRSHAVARDVILRLRLIGRPGFRDADQAEVALRKKVNIEAVRGSIIQIKAQGADPAFARQLAAGYAAAIRDRLATLSLVQTAEKRAVAESRMSEATIDLAKAQAAIAQFREANKLAVPEAQLGAAVTQLALLQARLQAKQVQLGTLLQFATGENVQVRATPSGSGANTLAGIAAKDSEYYNLYRNERFAQILSDIYTRYLESTTIDEMSASNSVDLLEPAYVDPQRHLNVWAEGLLILVILAAITAEFYILRPPVGRPPRGA